jgi:hypothetical protein
VRMVSSRDVRVRFRVGFFLVATRFRPLAPRRVEVRDGMGTPR